jgi:hypothetical protein
MDEDITELVIIDDERGGGVVVWAWTPNRHV